MKIWGGCRWPNLWTDRNHFRVYTNKPLVEHLRQVSTSDQWSRRSCDNEIVTVLSKGHFAILKMAAFRPYLLTDQNYFQTDTSRHCENFICKISTKTSSSFRGDGITVKTKDGCQRSYLSTDRNHFRATMATSQKRLENIRYARCDNEKTFTDILRYGRTDAPTTDERTYGRSDGRSVGRTDTGGSIMR